MNETWSKSPLGVLLSRPAKRAIMPRSPLGRTTQFALLAAAAAIILALVYLDPLGPQWRQQLSPATLTFFGYVTHLGYSGYVLWPTGLLILILPFVPRPAFGQMTNTLIAALISRAGLIFLAVGVPGLAVTIAKRLVGRLRPHAAEAVGFEGHLAFEPFAWKASAASFPSGHATTAFAAAVVLGALWPRARVPLLALAALIAFSRVPVHAHYLSDIIAGAVVGSLGAAMIVIAFAARRLALKVTQDGHIEPMPGPSARRLMALVAGVFGMSRHRQAATRL